MWEILENEKDKKEENGVARRIPKKRIEQLRPPSFYLLKMRFISYSVFYTLIILKVNNHR